MTGSAQARSAADPCLGHELSHVVSPPVGALIGRQTFPPQPVVAQGASGTQAPQADATATIRAWLERHQLAPPTSQPDEGERHVLLNGEDMPISQAVQLASAALAQPPDTVRAVIMAALQRAPIVPAAQAPVVGRGNQVPGLDLGLSPSGHLSMLTLKMLQMDEVDAYLAKHGFSPPDIRDPTGAAVVFDGEQTTVDAVANKVMALYRADAIGGVNMSYLSRQEVLDHLRQQYVAARGGPGNQIVFGYMLVPRSLQAVTGTQDPLNPLRDQHQFSVTITRQHHPNDSPGLESSFQATLTIDDAGNLMNVQAGGQEAIVVPLLKGWIQVSGLVQTMAMANWNQTASGSTVIAPAIQLAAGGQVLLTPNPHSGPFRFLRGHVQVGVQALGSVTFPLTSAGGAPVAGLRRDWC